MNTAYLLLGSNQGDRILWLNTAIAAILRDCGNIIQKSSVYETAAWGLEEQPDFLNQVIHLQTKDSALPLLQKVQAIEKTLGRQRDVKWGQRTLDIDILLFNNQVIHLPQLSIPHPYLHQRRFTLVPLNEIAPSVVHPLLHKSIYQLLEDCTDTLPANKYTLTH